MQSELNNFTNKRSLVEIITGQIRVKIVAFKILCLSHRDSVLYQIEINKCGKYPDYQNCTN